MFVTEEQVYQSRKTIELNGKWQFKKSGETVWADATVPGCNFTDLYNNGLIEDPFYRINETKLQWIEHCDWEYRKAFTVQEEDLNSSEAILNFEGLDTYCDVFLNGELILKNRNMFTAANVRCIKNLQVGTNELFIKFRSPINEVMPIHEKKGFVYPAENDKSEERLSVYTRKAPYHYGWDWGPRFVTSGIWRDVNLEFVLKTRISDIQVHQCSIEEDKAQLIFVVELETVEPFSGQLTITCEEASDARKCVAVSASEGTKKFSVPLTIKNPKLWWPNGLGEAHLYDFKILIESTDTCLFQANQKVGLRTIEVVNEEDEIGESFYVKVNGHPVFMKGANYIPSDSFLTRVSSSKYKQIFEDAVSANMNMLRVWGGGIYENDEFYDLADEYGILIWQDFMFACSLYPADQEFISNVKEEVSYNMKRLRNHPCLALWCGNNETEMGIEFWNWQETFGYSDATYARLKEDYDLLFKTTLPSLVKDLDPSRFYFSSSPIGFWENTQDDSKGDNHY
ncbi:MAG: glycoside hydrolase family 2 protein, partial [Bacteroidia bacterium]